MGDGGLLKERCCFFFWSVCVPVYMERLVHVHMEVENSVCKALCMCGETGVCVCV